MAKKKERKLIGYLFPDVGIIEAETAEQARKEYFKIIKK